MSGVTIAANPISHRAAAKMLAAVILSYIQW